MHVTAEAAVEEHCMLRLHKELDVASFLRLSSDAQDQLMDGWDLWLLLGLYQLPYTGRRVANRGITRWRDRLFDGFGTHLSGFLHIMHVARAILVGSALVAALERVPRTQWSPPSRDFFVPYDKFVMFYNYFTATLGGVVVARSRPRPPAELFSGVTERVTIAMDIGYVNVYATADTCAMRPLASAYSTHLFNFVSSNAIVSGYPWSVIKKIATIHSRPTPDLDFAERLLRAYITRRGYRRLAPPAHRLARPAYDNAGPLRDLTTYPAGDNVACSGDSSGQVGDTELLLHVEHGMCSHEKRYFGDYYCLTVRMDDADEGRAGTSGSSTTSAKTVEWRFGGVPCGSTTCTDVAEPCAHTVTKPGVGRIL